MNLVYTSVMFYYAVLEVEKGVFERIVDWLIEKFKKDKGIDPLNDKQALRLTKIAEKAKLELSSLPISILDSLTHIDTTLRSVKFEEMCSDLLDQYAF
uniref:Uncharacterized protein n=1 Tax=Quercus lobata TaxID=97700 RepID=A0A7N2RCN9_QUELO